MLFSAYYSQHGRTSAKPLTSVILGLWMSAYQRRRCIVTEALKLTVLSISIHTLGYINIFTKYREIVKKLGSKRNYLQPMEYLQPPDSARLHTLSQLAGISTPLGINHGPSPMRLLHVPLAKVQDQLLDITKVVPQIQVVRSLQGLEVNWTGVPVLYHAPEKSGERGGVGGSVSFWQYCNGRCDL